MFLVRATFELRDGSRLRGFITPAFHEADLGVLSPHMFVGERCFRFGEGCLVYRLMCDGPSTRPMGKA
jgi:hypothetical protein